MGKIEIIDTNAETIHLYGMCGYKNTKIEGFRKKIEWLKRHYSKGMKYKILYSDKDGSVGGVEYIPGEYTWRSVEADGYMVIHCIYIIPRHYKQKGYGTLLLNECLKDAQGRNMHGAAVVTRNGTWMAGKELFIKNGFEVCDKAPPDFELLMNKFNQNALSPKFTGNWEEKLKMYERGLIIFSSDQCPYAAKAVNEIGDTAEKIFGIVPRIIELETCDEARKSPCAFGTFCIMLNGEVIADHPISKTRFLNIMKALK